MSSNEDLFTASPALGSTGSVPVFGSTNPAFKTSSRPAVGAPSIPPAFGATSTPAFGNSSTISASATPCYVEGTKPSRPSAFVKISTASPAFGSMGSAPVFGSSNPAFEASSRPAVGAPSIPSAFGATSTPAFGTSSTLSASTTPCYVEGTEPSRPSASVKISTEGHYPCVLRRSDYVIGAELERLSSRPRQIVEPGLESSSNFEGPELCRRMRVPGFDIGDGCERSCIIEAGKCYFPVYWKPDYQFGLATKEGEFLKFKPNKCNEQFGFISPKDEFMKPMPRTGSASTEASPAFGSTGSAPIFGLSNPAFEASSRPAAGAPGFPSAIGATSTPAFCTSSTLSASTAPCYVEGTEPSRPSASVKISTEGQYPCVLRRSDYETGAELERLSRLPRQIVEPEGPELCRRMRVPGFDIGDGCERSCIIEAGKCYYPVYWKPDYQFGLATKEGELLKFKPNKCNEQFGTRTVKDEFWKPMSRTVKDEFWKPMPRTVKDEFWKPMTRTGVTHLEDEFWPKRMKYNENLASQANEVQ